jgi:hypothetical protein
MWRRGGDFHWALSPQELGPPRKYINTEVRMKIFDIRRLVGVLLPLQGQPGKLKGQGADGAGH